jgi:hypothetical protein
VRERIFFEKMEGYTADEESRRDSQGEWSQTSEWMQEMAAPIFRSNQTMISQMLHGPNLFPSTGSAFRPPLITPRFNYSQGGELESHTSTVEAGIWQGKEEVAATVKRQPAGKKREYVSKEGAKKKKKSEKEVIEVGDSEEEEEEMGRTKWRDFEVHHLIAIRGEMEDEFAKSANKQGKIS